MTKEEFFERVKEESLMILKEKDEKIEAIIQNVTKANSISYAGLSFRNSKEGFNVQPVIYLDDFYDKFSDQDMTISEIASTVAEIYLRNTWDSDYDFSKISDFEYVKDNIICCLLNVARNKELLDDAPHIVLADGELAIYFRIRLPLVKDGEIGYITVKNNLADNWKISINELKEIGFANLNRINPCKFQTMFSVMQDMMPGAFEEDEEFIDNPMYILSTTDKSNGSIYMFDEDMMESIANELNDDLTILPSSINELIILRNSFSTNYDELRAMVREVNQTQVADTDFLSDEVFVYSRETKTIMVA